MSRKGIKNIKRNPKMPTEPKPDFAVVLTEGITKTGGLIGKLEVIDLLADQKCACGGNCSCKNNEVVTFVEEKVFKSNCLCVGYVGQNYRCPEHIAKTECPKCNCIDVEHEIHATAEFAEYSCKICGFFYARNLDNGNYQFM